MPLPQALFRDGTRRHPQTGLPGRGAATAPVIPPAVFLMVGVIRVPGPELVLDGGIILAAGILVVDQQAYGRAGGLALEDAGQDFHRVAFPALGHMAALAGFAPVQVMLQVLRAQRHPRRTAIHNARVARAVALAATGQREQFSECVARHVARPRGFSSGVGKHTTKPAH